MSAITTLASVVLGAVLAMAGGIWTERWKQRKEARVASRLVWWELWRSYEQLLIAVALGEWPDEFVFSDVTWTAQRDRLALVRSAKEFQQLQTVFLTFRQLVQTPPGQRPDPVLYWTTLLLVNSTLRMLGQPAGVDRELLDWLRKPLQDRLAEIRDAEDHVGAMNLSDDAITKTLDNYPPELRARAAEATARLLSGRLTTNGPREPVSEDPEPNPAS